jgi:hypothetical protein
MLTLFFGGMRNGDGQGNDVAVSDLAIVLDANGKCPAG